MSTHSPDCGSYPLVYLNTHSTSTINISTLSESNPIFSLSCFFHKHSIATPLVGFDFHISKGYKVISCLLIFGKQNIFVLFSTFERVCISVLNVVLCSSVCSCCVDQICKRSHLLLILQPASGCARVMRQRERQLSSPVPENKGVKILANSKSIIWVRN